jgi:hypothetical protein
LSRSPEPDFHFELVAIFKQRVRIRLNAVKRQPESPLRGLPCFSLKALESAHRQHQSPWGMFGWALYLGDDADRTPVNLVS